jgi:hypothetical protein
MLAMQFTLNIFSIKLTSKFYGEVFLLFRPVSFDENNVDESPKSCAEVRNHKRDPEPHPVVVAEL